MHDTGYVYRKRDYIIAMACLLLNLSLWIATVIYLTSCQSTQDVSEQEKDVSRCGQIEQVMSQLMMISHQLMKLASLLHGDIVQLRKDVAEIKSATQRNNGRGNPLIY